MNLFSLLFAIHVGAPMVYAAANCRADANLICHFTIDDDDRLGEIVHEGDDPAQLAEMLGCRNLMFNEVTEYALTAMIELGREEIFKFIIPRLSFYSETEKSQVLSFLLRRAISKQNLDLARFVLHQDFRLQPRDYMVFWHPPQEGTWNLDELKQLILEHPDQVAALTPTSADMTTVKGLDHVRLLVDLARYCDKLRGLHIFDASRWLANLVASNTSLSEAKLAELAFFLIGEGANLECVISKFQIYHPEALQILKEWLDEDVKEPGCN
jgi:hypothetical protein